MRLNREQEDAVNHVSGPLLIFAGAGSGKTRVITNRIANLIRKKGVKGSEIVALSFTNKSAKEMAERVKKMVDKKKLRGIELSTFHALGLKILKRYIDRLGYKVPFNLQTPMDLEGVIADLLKAQKVDPKEVDPKLVLSVISRIKNSGDVYRSQLHTSEKEHEMVADAIYEDYTDTLKKMNSVDFDDLILLSMQLLQTDEEVSAYYRKRFQYYMVDEFQDTNLVQYNFLKLLMGENRNLCVVGDDDQSIYAFRGSDVGLILNFEKDFPDTKVIKLLQNYRSTKQILGASNSVIKKNANRRVKELWSTNEGAHPVSYVQRNDEKDEAVYVVDQIEKELVRHKRKGSEIAILFRTNYQSRPFEEELRQRSIPYNLVGGYNFFDRKEVRDLISYLKVIANAKDEVSLFRILNYPRRGIGQTTISRLYEKAAEEEIGLMEVLQNVSEKEGYIPTIKNKTIHAIYEFVGLIQKYRKEFFQAGKMSSNLTALIKELNFEKEFTEAAADPKVAKAKMLNLSELVNMLAYFESDWDSAEKPTLFDFIMRLSLLMDDTDNDVNANDKRVQLMTMHLSKGLEFQVVFLVGLEEGILPNSRVLDEGGDVDEERRLFYVGMTRAKEKLTISGAIERKKFGESYPTTPSRFLEEIDSEYLESYYLDKGENESSTGSLLEELEKLKFA
ncbi:MAG: UvrD-helicase domain-containing protein [Spirochaetota bacterium]